MFKINNTKAMLSLDLIRMIHKTERTDFIMCESDLCNSLSEGYQKSLSIYTLENPALE